jgi:hypothetical protein
MKLAEGTWVKLTGGGIAKIVEVDPEKGVVLAETPDGEPVDRPLAYAEARWQPIGEADLRVQRILDPVRIKRLVGDDPVALVVDVINQAGGAARVADVRAALTPQPIAVDDFELWWKNVQRRLAGDVRVEASNARDGLYRVASALGSRATPLGDPVSDERRGGRLLADARHLLRARALVGDASAAAREHRRFIEQEAGLFRLTELDPTDRLLSFDLAARANLESAEGASEALGEDLLQVDLTRIRDKATRRKALVWAARFAESVDSEARAGLAAHARPILASSGAIGDEFEASALELARTLESTGDVVSEGRLGWAVPGSEEAGKPKYPDDLDAFEKRLGRWAATGGASAEKGSTIAGAVDALQVLHDSNTHHQQWQRLMERLAALVWESLPMADAILLLRTRHRRLRPAAAAALVRVAGRSSLPLFQPLLTNWFKESPEAYRSVLLDLAGRTGADPIGLIANIARGEISATRAPALAAMAFDMARADGRTDEVGVAVANLAGTIAEDTPGVREALTERASDITRGLLAEDSPTPGQAWFGAREWKALADSVLRKLRDEREAADAAKADAAAARAQVARLEQSLQLREQALSSSRTDIAANERGASQRVATNSLRPVVTALADSFEANSLAGLQARLIALMARVRIEPIANVGEVVSFDPTRHRWVGDGVALDRALVLSPGFLQRGEGADSDIVLVPARVVGPKETDRTA